MTDLDYIHKHPWLIIREGVSSNEKAALMKVGPTTGPTKI